MALEDHVWFTRGWTLKELIAPGRLHFFTHRCLPDGGRDITDWVLLGDRIDLGSHLSEITGIDADILNHSRNVYSVSVEKRMSWASKRTTFKIEDSAYILVGLFNVNMPLIYGEGEKALLRLQDETMKGSSDESLFAWRDPKARPGVQSDLLAKSPDMFEHSGQFFSYYDWEPRDPIYKTYYGLRITLPLHYVPKSIALNRTMASLNCPAPGRTDGFAGIYLERLVAYDKLDETNTISNTHASSWETSLQ